MISKSDPRINQNIVHSYYGTEEVGLDLSSTNQHLAIAVLDVNGNTKYDLKYMQLIAYYSIFNEDGTHWKV